MFFDRAKVQAVFVSTVKRIGQCLIKLSLLWLFLGPVEAAPPGKVPVKVALVIANADYQAVPRLTNPISDAHIVAQALTRVGFDSVTVKENLTLVDMARVIREFSVQADGAQVALIYYAGHGMEINGTNYLVPIDAHVARDRDLDSEAVKLDMLLDMTQGAKRLRIIILDACRNNPFEVSMKRTSGVRAVSRGLAPIEPMTDSLVVYSAKAGSTADDGDAANSPFATAMARRLVEPGREINMLLRRVRDDVIAQTGGKQEPFIYGSQSSQEFYFIDPPRGGGGGAAVDIEAETWSLCKTAASRFACESYLRSYPNGRFVVLANTRMRDMAPVAMTAVAQPVRPAITFPIETAQQLGVSVRAVEDGSGIMVQSVSSSGLAYGQLLAGDIIVAINSQGMQRDVSPARQLDAAMGAGRAKLLVRRGPTSTIVVLRAP